MILAIGLGACAEPGQGIDGPVAVETMAAEAVREADDSRAPTVVSSESSSAVERLQAELAALARDDPGVAGAPASPPGGQARHEAELLPKRRVPEEEQRYFEAVVQEIAALHTAIQRLQQSVDTHLENVVEELEAENKRLRREVERLYALRREEGSPLPVVPMPVGEAINDILGTPQEDQPAAETLALAVHNGLRYAVVSEWGRGPEEAVQMGPGIPSLKGMICAVPPGSRDSDLIALGRWLRSEFDAYDNINIEVFDHFEAASNYAEDNTPAPEHHVLSVSRHADSALDIILLIHGETTTTVPWKE